MNRRTFVSGCVVSAGALASGAAIAQEASRRDVGRRHPNLAAAQRFCQQAYERIVAAQQANEWDLGGHAQRAKDLLDRANGELKEAAEAANRDHDHDRH
ncbi:MAG TPA: hypothetical protein VGR47_13530 [Terracidiphilus sp.]|nr:hypothetical protein [Terracidiphilus sp.]